MIVEILPVGCLAVRCVEHREEIGHEVDEHASQ
jgi:hypothetical protein